MTLHERNGPPHLVPALASAFLSYGWFFSRSRFPEICSAFVRLRFFPSRPFLLPPPSPLFFAHGMVRNSSPAQRLDSAPPPSPHVVLCPLFLLSSCLAKITYGTTAPSESFYTACLCWTLALIDGIPFNRFTAIFNQDSSLLQGRRPSPKCTWNTSAKGILCQNASCSFSG